MIERNYFLAAIYFLHWYSPTTVLKCISYYFTHKGAFRNFEQ